MNKNAIKNYAVWARVQLLEAVKQRAYEYEITEAGENKPGLDAVGGRVLSAEEKRQRQELIERIRQKGYAQVMEEAAYTWFNRFIALRFMEVNGYLPSRVRVFTDENGAFKPEIMKEAMTVELDGLDRAAVLDLLDRQDNEALYKYLLITQCNALNAALPLMFERIDNWTELLFPAHLLRSESVLDRLVSDIPEEDWTDAVQIIGWLYQYYNSELKDETFALLKKNVKITKERIPAATQLFTPDWIVRYMVENSLGRLWYEGHRDFDKSAWNYYLDEAEQEPEVERQLAALRAEYAGIKPEEIKVIDPCMGSGHILVYAFDVLMQIYTAAGWSERDAAQSILENNLYGLDIDERAAQLAYFAVMMKARQYDRRILTRGVRPHVYGFRESNGINADYLQLLGSLAPLARRLYDNFRDAMEYGSIIESKLTLEELQTLRTELDAIRAREYDNFFDSARQFGLVYDFAPLIELADTLARKYDVVVTNPPYMGGSGMSARLGEFVKKNYPESKSDLFAVFIERCGAMVRKNGYQGMITQHAWMFLSSFEKLRGKLLTRDTVNMAHLGARAFEEIGGEVVQTTSFVLQNKHIEGYKGTYCRLIEPTTQQGKEDMFLAGENRYTAQQSNFSKIPGSPVAYWVSEQLLDVYARGQLVGDTADVKIGMGTGKNEIFVREWWEVQNSKIDFSLKSINALEDSAGRYFPYNKGGEFRLWYGNLQEVLWFDRDGRKYMNSMSGHRENGAHDFYCKEGLTWSFISSSKFGIRYLPTGCFFDVAGSTLFSKVDNSYTLGFLSSCVCFSILRILNPTLNYQAGNIKSLPLLIDKTEDVNKIVNRNIDLSKTDWDSFETSWDFKKHPLI